MSDAAGGGLWWRAGLLLLPPAIFLIVYGVYAPNQPLLNPDSASYLTFNEFRSGGYPFFLSLLKPVVRGLGDYTIAQRLLYAVSVLVLCIELLRHLGSPAIAVLAEIALLFNPEVNRYHFSIFTESLFLSICALLLAAVLAHLRAGGLASLAAASVLAGCLIAIRPGGYAVLPVLAVLLLGRRHAGSLGVWKRLLAAIIPVLVMLALESVYYAAHHPGPRQSLAPIHLLGKAAMIEVPEAAATMASAPAESLPLRQALASAFAPVRRLIAEAPNQPARCLLDGTYELFAQYGFAPEERALAMAREGPDALTRIALERLRHGIGGYLWLSINELACMWTLGAADVAEQSAMYAYVEGRRPLPFEADILSTLQSVRQPPFAELMRLAMYGIAALLAASGLALIITLARHREPSALLAAGGVCGLVVHAALVLTALTGVGIPRYVLGLWVPMAVGTGLSALWILELCRSYRPSRRRNIDERPATDLTARDLS